MPNPLSPLFSRWEANPPVISATETRRPLKDVLSILQAGSLLREIAATGSVDCPDCSRRCRVEPMQNLDGTHRGYIQCRDCGISPVSPEMLRRWEIDTPAMLLAIFRDAKLSVEASSPPFLWKIGTMTWAGRSRQLWFARAFRRDGSDAAIEILRRNPKSIVFATTGLGAERWHQATNSLVIPLEAVVSLDANRFLLDIEDIEGQIIDAGMGPAETKKPTSKKRGGRLVDIEKLRDAMIEHLRSARDHAYATKDQYGAPRLLPRPTQKELSMQLEINYSKVNNCLNDKKAVELQLYWETANDLNRIMNFKGAISRGRKT